MEKRIIELHDEALLLRPDGANHDTDSCPVCNDWAMRPDGVPNCFDGLEGEAKLKPFGDVAYADEGSIDGVHRFPIDTLAHATWSLNYISDEENAKTYTEERLSEITEVIEQALGKFGQEPDDESAPEELMDTITKETHEALLNQAVAAATAELQGANTDLEAQVASLTEERDSALARAETAESETQRLEKDLDTAQVKLKTTEDEVASLRTEIETRDEEQAKAETARERADKVKNLGLFPEEYIQEKAARWAEYSEEDFAELVEDWKKAHETSGGKGDTPATTDTASSMTGSSEGETANKSEEQGTPRKRVLGIA